MNAEQHNMPSHNISIIYKADRGHISATYTGVYNHTIWFSINCTWFGSF